MEQIKTPPRYTDDQRMRLRGFTALAGEFIANYWPMRTFVHHNPLHGLESQAFSDAVALAQDRLGGTGYLPPAFYRDAFRSGRITPHHLDAVLKNVAPPGPPVLLGDRKITSFDIFRAHLLSGIRAPALDVLDSLHLINPDRAIVEALVRHMNTSDAPSTETGEGLKDAPLTESPVTLSSWCDQILGTRLVAKINAEMIKWCEAFLDENHASWPMPERGRGFYGTWKYLAQMEWTLRKSRKSLSLLPDAPEDALLGHLDGMGIPSTWHQDYLSIHLAALAGWPAFIKWRANQNDYAYQKAFPADLVQFLAVRLWYERDLVDAACRDHLGTDGTYGALRTHLEDNPRERHSRATPSGDSRHADAWRLVALSRAMSISPENLLSASPEILRLLLTWLDAFPENRHGPVWLDAFEAGYREALIDAIRLHFPPSAPPDSSNQDLIRPQAQAVFCIDVRSEPFRRHLESVGDYETFGFAGFFSVFVRFRALESRQESDQFPVIMKARNSVREVLRSYHGGRLLRHRSGQKMLHAGHELLHDLKENVVTPYVAVESMGWFYALPLVGKTLFPTLQSRLTRFLRSLFVPPVSTALTVDKLSREEVNEMLAAEQRAVIRKALTDQFGDRNLNLSLERLEFLRQRALDLMPPDAPKASEKIRSTALTPKEEEFFIKTLRDRYQITHGWAFARMERMTRIGFTLTEQVMTVETALRMMGMTKNFARLVLFCGHGSTSENNPFESALDCGACGGNKGKPNARILAAMANKPQVREQLSQNGLVIPADTYFIAGEHDTTTDCVELYDLEDIPHTHNKDLLRLAEDLRETGIRTSRERCSRFPEVATNLSRSRILREVNRKSTDWSEVRPEWGLSGNASFIIGRRALTRRVDLSGRAFLHSYDYRNDGKGHLLEGIMTGPQVVGEWINMEHYFSSVDNAVFGGGSKIYHNVVGRFGIMAGPQSDLLTGLAQQTVMDGSRMFHEPMRLLTLIEAPLDRISTIIRRHTVLKHFYDNEWVHLMALDPGGGSLHAYIPREGWVPYAQGSSLPTPFKKESPS